MNSKYLMLKDYFLFRFRLVFPVANKGESYQNVCCGKKLKNEELLLILILQNFGLISSTNVILQKCFKDTSAYFLAKRVIDYTQFAFLIITIGWQSSFFFFIVSPQLTNWNICGVCMYIVFV